MIHLPYMYALRENSPRASAAFCLDLWRVHIGSVIEWSRYFLRKRALKVAPALVDGYFGLRF